MSTQTTDLVPRRAVDMDADELLIRFLEEGAPLSMATRASGIPTEILAQLPLTRPPRPPTAEELSAKAARLASKAVDTLMDQLEAGNPAVRLRAATAIVGHPLRRMAPDSSAEIAELKGVLMAALRGEMPDELTVTE
jgi:hypothetical protein